MPLPAFVALTIAWISWIIPFFRLPKGSSPQTLDKRARWGIVLEGIAFFIVWSHWAWAGTLPLWRWAAATPFLTAGPVLSWTSARTLGRQWRFDAGLNADHRLVRSGAYALVRHPIYASMICMLLGIGLLLTPMPLLLLAFVLCVIGTEIRVRIEDRLLAARF